MEEWKDSRWHGDILSDKDRERVFREYCKELSKHEEEKRKKKERYLLLHCIVYAIASELRSLLEYRKVSD